jgi:predicted RNA binding protein YcfA (HicA-like mRNA interferase family)
MASPPVLSGREVVKVSEKFGWQVSRQSGSHIITCCKYARAKSSELRL